MEGRGDYWTDVTDPHLMVWYQMEPLPDFLKLYGKVDTTLKAGTTYLIEIEDNFDAPSIGSEKWIVLTELGMFGGKNFILSFILLGAAGAVFCVLMVFFTCYFMRLHKKNRENEAFIASLKF